MMRKTKITALLVSVLTLITLCLTACAPPEESPYASVNKNYLYGIDEPVMELISKSGSNFTHTVQGFDLDITADLFSMLNVKSFRFRIPIGFMTSPGQYDEDMYQKLVYAEQKMREAGVERFVGLLEVFPSYTGFRPDSAKSVPHLDDANYKDWMEAVAEISEQICKLFPNIKYWEMGNETNSKNFFHPNGYQKVEGSIEDQAGGFTHEDQVKIYTDFMYYASKGIKKASADNMPVTGGFAPMQKSFYNIQFFIEDIYKEIASGNLPTCSDVKSTDKRDYFEALCWHPYDDVINDNWVKKNNDIYQVVIDNGDEGVKVFFTEFGFTDLGFQDRQDLQMEYTRQAFKYMESDQMPYIESCMSFRMYQCSYAQSWGGARQNFFGFFSEPVGDSKGFAPRPKAYILQEIYGGTGNLEKYADLTNILE